MLRRFVSWFEMAALLAVVVFVGMLFLNSPTPPPGTPAAVVEAAGGVDGGALYGKRCAGCHGGDLKGSEKGPPLLHKIYEPSHHADAAFQLATANWNAASAQYDGPDILCSRGGPFSAPFKSPPRQPAPSLAD